MSTRRKVDNRKCLLLKFTNENYQNEVGFASWLSKKDQKNVENLIKARKEVSISWPCNVQIQPAEKIEKDLKTASFEDKSVIILAFGDWVELKEKMKNLAKSALIDPTKSSRKTRSQKIYDTDSQAAASKKSRPNKKDLEKSDEKLLDDIEISQKEKEDKAVYSVDTSDSEEDPEMLMEMMKKLQNKLKKKKIYIKPEHEASESDEKNNVEIDVNHSSPTSSSPVMSPKKKTPMVIKTENKVSESNVPKQGYQIPDEYIKCTRKTSPRELTYDLADKVFGHEVLCRSSMNGTVSNFLKKHCPGIKAKPALDKEKLLAIQDQVFKYFPKDKEIKSTFRAAMRAKLNDADKIEKAKKKREELM